MANLKVGTLERTTASICEAAYHSDLTAISVESVETADKNIPLNLQMQDALDSVGLHIAVDACPEDS